MDAPPEIQEKQMDKLISDYETHNPELLSIYPKLSANKAMALQHFIGLENAKKYLKDAISYGEEIAQQLLDKKLGNKYANLTVKEYLRKFAQ